jgi:hypothetical protein
MKKIFLIITMMYLSIFLYSETIIWEETFEPVPTGWELEGNWQFDEGHHFLFLNWHPAVDDYDMSVTSPMISLPNDVSDLILSHYLSQYTAVDEIAEINVISGETSTTIWNWNYSDGNWGNEEGTETVLSLTDFAGEDIQLQFRSHGTSSGNISIWLIHDITITATFENDLAAVKIVGPPNAEANTQDTWNITIKNNGQNAQSDYMVKFYSNEVEVGSIVSTDELAPLDSREHSFNWTPEIVENTFLRGEVFLAEDEFMSNNSTDVFNLEVFPTGEKQYLIWNNDNDSYYYDPDNGEHRDSEYGVEQALIANDINYKKVEILPEVLYNYDIIFVCLGQFCVV